MSKRFLFLTLSLSLPAILAAAEIREQILVVINNHIITKRSFQQAFEQESASLYRQFSGKELDEKLRNTREKVLQELIDGFILEDKASELKINIPDEAVRGAVEEMKKQNNLASDADLEKALKASLGVGLPEYMKNMKQHEIRQGVLYREVYPKIAIEEQELKAYYEEHKTDYKQASRFRIRELVLSKGSTPEEQMAAMTRLEQIQAAVRQGRPFEELVKEYSTAPSKSMNGDLGWMTRGLIRDTLENAAMALSPDQISDPIITETDIHLIQLLAKEDESYKPFTEIKNELMNKLREPKAQNAIQHYLQGLRVRANVRYMIPRELILKG